MAAREDELREGTAGPRRDVFDLAEGRGRGRGRAAPATRAAGEDPVMITRQVITLLMRLMTVMPGLAPIVREFLDKLSAAASAGGPPAGGPPAGGPPPGAPPVGGPPPGEPPPAGVPET